MVVCRQLIGSDSTVKTIYTLETMCISLLGDWDVDILDLVFTVEEQKMENIKYLSPLGCSDHVIVLIKLNSAIQTSLNEKTTLQI